MYFLIQQRCQKSINTFFFFSVKTVFKSILNNNYSLTFNQLCFFQDKLTQIQYCDSRNTIYLIYTVNARNLLLFTHSFSSSDVTKKIHIFE